MSKTSEGTSIVVQVIHEGKVIASVERDIAYDFVSDPYDRGTMVVVQHPNEDLAIEACNLAEDYLNQNPELWARETEEADYSGPDDPTGQGR